MTKGKVVNDEDLTLAVAVVCIGAVVSIVSWDGGVWLSAAVTVSLGLLGIGRIRQWNQRRRNRRIPPPTPETQP